MCNSSLRTWAYSCYWRHRRLWTDFLAASCLFPSPSFWFCRINWSNFSCSFQFPRSVLLDRCGNCSTTFSHVTVSQNELSFSLIISFGLGIICFGWLTGACLVWSSFLYLGFMGLLSGRYAYWSGCWTMVGSCWRSLCYCGLSMILFSLRYHHWSFWRVPNGTWGQEGHFSGTVYVSGWQRFVCPEISQSFLSNSVLFEDNIFII